MLRIAALVVGLVVGVTPRARAERGPEAEALNKDTPAMAGLDAHHQDPKRPGATAAGAACGKAADLFPGVADLPSAVHGWMAGLYHRRPILAPSLDKIGVGYERLRDGTYMAALMFVDGKRDAGWPVAYPANGQRDVPLEFGREIPNPIPGERHVGGYPITLQFPPFDAVTGVTATLVDGDGKAVPSYVSTPEQPATSFGQYGVVCVIAKQPLRPGGRYTARIKGVWKGRPLTRLWSFTTVNLRRVTAADEAALVSALGSPSLVRGTVAWGGMMDSATAYLALAVPKSSKYEMVSVIVPLAVWQALGRGRPEAAKGAAIEVEATPVLAQGRYLNLPVSLASQLHFLK